MINMCQGFLKDCESCKHLNKCGIYDAYQYGLDRSNEKMTKQIKYNGLLIRPFKHLYCGLIRGHKWENTSPLDLHWVCQKCIYCGKERVV